MSNVVSLRNEFTHPSSRFRPLALWFWNGKLSEDEIRRQIAELKKGGLGGFFMHARRGYDAGYLSDRWWDMVAAAVEAAREHDLTAWIYDEDSWPSGSAGGRVTEGHDDDQAWKLTIATTGAGQQDTVERQDGPCDVIAAFRVKLKSEHSDDGTVSERLVEWKRVDPEATYEENSHGDDWRFLSCKVAPHGYVDLLNPEVTRRFLEMTHRQYEARFGEEFGRVIQGVFTDEPQIPQWPGSVEPTFPWTPGMPELFRERYGYDLISMLPLLVYDAENRATTIGVRCHFWQLVSELLAEGFYRQAYEYCDSKGLLFTGHAIDEEDLFGHVRMQGDLMRNLGYMHIPGVDHLFVRTDQSYLIEGAVWSSYRVVEGTIHIKHASSAAHIHGRKQCLAECFGGAGWDLAPSQMKRMVNWMAVLGVNLFTPHGYYYSIEGRRKFDWPPSHFFQSAFWPYHQYFADYAGRLSCLLTGGVHVAPVAVLYPITTMWAHYRGPADRGGVAGHLDETYRTLCYDLMRLGFDYDVVTEDALQKAHHVDGKIQIADESYSVLVLPPMDVLPPETVRAILRLLGCDRDDDGEGAKLLVIGRIPGVGSDGYTDAAHMRLVQLAMSGTALDPARFLPQFDWEAFASALRAWIYPDMTLCGTWYRPDQGSKQHEASHDALPGARDGLLPDGIYACHRRYDEGDVFFLVNDTGNYFSGKAVLHTGGRAELWDPESGEMTEAIERLISDQEMEVGIELGPYGAVAVMVFPPAGHHKDIGESAGPFIEGHTHSSQDEIHHGGSEPVVVDLPDRWDFRIQGSNQLPFLFWEARPELNEDGLAQGWHLPHSDRATKRGWPTKHRRLGDPCEPTWWRWSATRDGWRRVAITMGPPPADLFTDMLRGVIFRGLNQALWYRTYCRICGEVAGSLSLTLGVIKGKFSLFINGVEVPFQEAGKAIRQFSDEVKIDGLLVPGLNVIAVRIDSPLEADSLAPMDYSDISWGVIEPPRLHGQFAVWWTREGIPLLASPDSCLQLGSWVDQGYPYYSGTASYTVDCELNMDLTELQRVELDLGTVREVAELRVNGISCGVRLWPPYVYDVTRQIRSGINHIEVAVTNVPTNGLLPPEVKYDRLVPHLYGQTEFWYGATEPVPSGLLGQVRLLVFQNQRGGADER